jgi:tetratricopeptide (TPR) repeat protein
MTSRRTDRRSRDDARARPQGARLRPVAEASLAAASTTAANRAAVALLVALVLLTVLRAGAAFTPGMGAWGANGLRFLSPVLSWPLWILATLALLPSLGRPLTPLLDRAGDAIAERPGIAGFVLGVLGGSTALLMPDRVRFVGDFLLRQGTVEEAGRPGVLFPQALPLDVWLHVSLPTALMEAGWLDANGAARMVGAIEAALLAVLAMMLARALRLRGAAALAVTVVAWSGGALSMFTGYSKAFGELTVLVAALAAFGLRALRSGEPPLAMGIVLAIGLTLHRSALGFVPVWLVAWVLWAIEHRDAAAWKRPAVWIALAIPIAALGLMIPKILATILRWDTVHLDPAEVKQHGGPLRAAFAGHRPADIANLLLVLAPILPAALAALAVLGRDLPRRREALLIAALALPLVGVIPFIHPAQGLFRDWDDFASAGAALTVVSAWVLGEVMRATPRFAWLGLAAALGALVPSLQWLALQNDLDRGLKRVEAIVTEAPARTGPERGNTWDYLGIRNFRLERWKESSRAFSIASETSPSPRILLQWAVAETQAGDLREAQRVCRILVTRNPDDFRGWSQMAAVSAQLADEPATREAAEQMLRLHPGDPNATGLLQQLDALHAHGASGATPAKP